MELVQKYTNLYPLGPKQFRAEQVLNPQPRAIVEQIDMITKIIEAGYAYEINGSRLFWCEEICSQSWLWQTEAGVIDDLLETTLGNLRPGRKAWPGRFRFVEGRSTRTYHAVDKPLGVGFPSLAYWMLGHGHKIFRCWIWYTWRWYGPAVSAPWKWDCTKHHLQSSYAGTLLDAQ